MKEYFDKLFLGDTSILHEEIKMVLEDNKKMFIVTANPEIFMMADDNPSLKDMLLNDNTVVIPDGIGIVKAARSLGLDIKERIPGVELASYLLSCANDLKKNVFLYGAKPEVMDALLAKIEDKYPNLTVSGAYHGYDQDVERIKEHIYESKPDIVMAALGMPRQEFFASECATKLEKGVFLGVGGSFDVISGIKKRAPAFFIKHNLEWFYRICKEPSRIGRFYKNNVKFIFKYKK